MKNLTEAVLILYSVLLSVTGTEKVIYAQVGESVTLTAPGGIQNTYANWYFVDGDKNRELAWINSFGRQGISQDLNWMLSVSGYSLTIGNMQDEKFGKFCFKFSEGIQEKIKVTFKVIKVKDD